MQGKIKIFSGSAHPQLAKAICDQLGVPLGETEVLKFANDNIMVKVLENVREADVFIIQPSCEPVNDGLVELLITLDALKHASAARITAVTPYFPYARSDKKDRPRISIAARLMADLLERAGADRILTMDLHSPQLQGFFRIPVDQLIAAPIICDHLKATRDLANYILVAGDAGEAKELGRYANRLHLPMAIVDKRRYGDDDRAVATNLIGSVDGKMALIVDDEISTASTMVEAAEFVMRYGALGVEAAAVHPILCGPAIERLQRSSIGSVVLTDTVPVPQFKRIDKITLLSVAPLLARAIKAIHDGDSVSALFR